MINYTNMKPMNTTRYFVLGCILTLFAATIGLLAGAQYGGNNPVPFEYGGLPGYEGAGLFGATLLSAIAALVWTYVFGSSSRQRQIFPITLAVCIAELLFQHILGVQAGAGFFVIILLPILWQIPVLYKK